MGSDSEKSGGGFRGYRVDIESSSPLKARHASQDGNDFNVPMVAFFEVDPGLMRQVGIGTLMDIVVVGRIGEDVSQLPEDAFQRPGQRSELDTGGLGKPR